MKNFIKIITLSIYIVFVFSCGNNVTKTTSRYEGAVSTSSNTKDLIANKCILIYDEYGSIEITIEGGTQYDSYIKIENSELIQTSNDSYQSSKNNKRYSFTFYNTYMKLIIENNDNTTTEGTLSKVN